jgi:hypothetical protein
VYSTSNIANKDIQKILKTPIHCNPKFLRLKEKSMPNVLDCFHIIDLIAQKQHEL